METLSSHVAWGQTVTCPFPSQILFLGWYHFGLLYLFSYCILFCVYVFTVIGRLEEFQRLQCIQAKALTSWLSEIRK